MIDIHIVIRCNIIFRWPISISYITYIPDRINDYLDDCLITNILMYPSSSRSLTSSRSLADLRLQQANNLDKLRLRFIALLNPKDLVPTVSIILVLLLLFELTACRTTCTTIARNDCRLFKGNYWKVDHDLITNIYSSIVIGDSYWSNWKIDRDTQNEESLARSGNRCIDS